MKRFKVCSIVLGGTAWLALGPWLATGCSSSEASAVSEDAAPEGAVRVDAARAPTSNDAGDEPIACSPRPTSEAPRWAPPRPLGQDACTASEIKGYVAACVASAAPADCDAFKAANATCFGCIDSNEDDPTRGAVVFFQNRHYLDVNSPGCRAHAIGDLSDKSCPAAFGLYDECARHACSGCDVHAAGDLDRLNDCKTKADAVCATYLDAYLKCPTTRTPAEERCLGDGVPFLDLVARYATDFCTAPAADGGAGDAGVMGDASVDASGSD